MSAAFSVQGSTLGWEDSYVKYLKSGHWIQVFGKLQETLDFFG